MKKGSFGKILKGLGILGLLLAIPASFISLSFIDDGEVGKCAALLGFLIVVGPLVAISVLVILFGIAVNLGADAKTLKEYDPAVSDHYQDREDGAYLQEEPVSNPWHMIGKLLVISGVVIVLVLIVGRGVLATTHPPQQEWFTIALGVILRSFSGIMTGLILCIAGLFVIKKAKSQRS